MKINNFIILTSLICIINMGTITETLTDSYLAKNQKNEIEKSHEEIYNVNKEFLNITISLLDEQKKLNIKYIEKFKDNEEIYKKYIEKNELFYEIEKKILNNKLLFLESQYKIFNLSSDLEKFRIFKEQKHIFDNEYNQKLIKEEKPSLIKKFLEEIKNNEIKPKIF